MKQSIGNTYLIYFVSIFFVVAITFIVGILNYMKAFRINSGIANALENFEGYNNLSKVEIDRYLNGYGYRIDATGNANCPVKNSLQAISAYNDSTGQNHRYCIYEYNKNSDGYFKYGIITYIYIDLPVINESLAIPIYSETEKIYEFSV